MLVEFDSVEQFAHAVKEACVNYPAHPRSSWTADISFDDAIERATIGDESYVSKAMALIDKLDVDMPETRMFETVHSPFGPRVNMSDWLAGTPTPMRRKRRTNSDIAPVKIIVSTTCSMGIEAKAMEKRGYAILALLLKLQQVRPIQLYLLAELHGKRDGWHYQVIRIESQPLAVGVAAFALCNVGFARHLTYDYGRAVDNFNGAWPNGYHAATYASKRAARLNLTTNDLFIKEAHVNDKLVTQPIDWIKEQLTRFAGTEL